MSTDIDERVERGAALLDQVRPGWHIEVDITRLHLGSYTRCVLGQLFGEFRDGTAVLFPGDAAESIAYGFDGDDEHTDLTLAWLDLINERRWSARPGALQAVSS